MTFDFYGQKGNDNRFNMFADFISLAEHSGWNYCGMNVELDPTVDFINKNIKVRWTDINEDFNDQIIVHSLEEFQTQFKVSR